jgi:hypothetical protein
MTAPGILPPGEDKPSHWAGFSLQESPPVVTAQEYPLLEEEQKTFAHTEVFSVLTHMQHWRLPTEFARCGLLPLPEVADPRSDVLHSERRELSLPLGVI